MGGFAFHYISHDGADKVFAERLQARLRADGIPAWLVPESMKTTGTGEISMDRVQDLSRLHDKLLIVMSEASLESEWLSREIHLAHRREIFEFRRILFPIRIAPEETMARTDDTLRQNLSSYLIHDFSGWRYELSEPSIQALLKDLRTGFRPECEELSAFEDSGESP
ncbi:MAG TPA: toll/interleukin-1 receptor domain-containing protein [Planctomycetota bacterium]|nr:toll/interleukin-1 receptor domain-containing protein [Planctomycetota bacterium]